MTEPAMRGLGISRELVTFAIERAEMRGAQELALAVDEAHLPLLRAVQSLDFRKVDRFESLARPFAVMSRAIRAHARDAA